MKLVLIPAGEFMMGLTARRTSDGTDEPQHQVRITKPFYLGVHEVTQGQYERVMGVQSQLNSLEEGSQHPVER